MQQTLRVERGRAGWRGDLGSVTEAALERAAAVVVLHPERFKQLQFAIVQPNYKLHPHLRDHSLDRRLWV